MLSYRLVCVSLDGDKVTEGHFSTVKEAQERSEQMGSRWYFYPIHVVTGRVKIIDLPDVIETEMGILDLKGFKGKNLTTLLSFLKGFSQPV